MAISVTVLGANSAIPIGNRLPTSQIVNVNQHLYMIDCGEGAQIQARKNKIKIQRIKAIFISHLHGDHFFGLFGLLGTMNLLGRQMPLKIVSPPGLSQLIKLQQHLSKTEVDFDLTFEEISEFNGQIIFQDETVKVSAIPLKHRIPTMGFRFDELPKDRTISKFAIDEFKIPISAISGIKKGADYFSPSGEIIPNEQLTTHPPKAYSYAFCSDTKYSETIVDYVQGCDLLYHEATFLESEKKRAKTTFHSTASEAGRIASLANVNKLIIGHFSARYLDISAHLDEAKKEFSNTFVAIEGKTYTA